MGKCGTVRLIIFLAAERGDFANYKKGERLKIISSIFGRTAAVGRVWILSAPIFVSGQRKMLDGKSLGNPSIDEAAINVPSFCVRPSFVMRLAASRLAADL